MKKIYKTLGLVAITLFSFYYTEKIAILMQNKSPIMQSINEIEDNYKVEAVNATIEENYVIPGIMGRMINKSKSYVNMKAFGLFNEYYLIFDNIKPDISLEDNKDKIIKKGNKEKKAVAFLLEDGSEQIKNYLKENKIPASLLIQENTYQNNNYFEQINNDKEKYKNVESLLNKNNQNKNICYIKNLGKDLCQKEKKYLIEETMTLNSNNLIEAKKRVESGAIFYIQKNVNLEHLKLLIKEIEFKGLKIITVSDLISEKEMQYKN